MGKGYDPKQELLVLQAIQNLGQATEPEVREYIENYLKNRMTEVFPDGLDKASIPIERMIARWEKKKVITSKVYKGERMYSLQDIPWLGRLRMMHVLTLAPETAKEFLKQLEAEIKEKGAKIERTPNISDYVTVECLFEAMTPILGGDIADGQERHLFFPKEDGDTLFIRPNWIRGYVRDNLRLVNVVESIGQFYIAYDKGVFVEKPETFTTPPIRVKEGHCCYEAVKPGSKFKTIMSLPLSGCRLSKLDDWRNFFKSLEMRNIRGLGANPRVYGGKIKLLEMKTIEAMSGSPVTPSVAS